MGSSSPLIFDISSSDEELAFGSFDKGVDWGGGECDGVDYFDWLFREVGEKENGDKIDCNKNDDSDDVVILSEVLSQKDKKLSVEGSNSPSNKDSVDNNCGGVVVDDDDDDCVILDCDPNKPLVLVKDKVDDGDRGTRIDGDDDDNDDDDVEIVSEKGEVACRDFPHPRHLCAKFSFDSTSHEIYCGQCHCYVCDSLAPCSRWGTGINTFDHCHATDKDEYWKIERKNMKTGVKPAPSLPPSTSLPQTHSVRPTILRPCSVPLNNDIRSKVISQRTNNISRSAVSRYSPQTQLASSPQLQHNACNTNAVSSNLSPSLGHRGASISTPRVVFKRPGVLGTSLSNRHAYGSHISGNVSINGHHMHKRPMVHRAHDSNQLNVSSHAARYVLPQVRSPASQSAAPSNHSLARPQITHQPYSTSLVRDPRQITQSQIPSQSLVRSNNCVNVGPFQSVAFRPSVDVNLQNVNLVRPHLANHLRSPAPRQNTPSYQSNPGFMVSSSNLGLGNRLENEVHSHQIPSLFNARGDTEHQNHTQNGVDLGPNVAQANQNYSLGHDAVQVRVDAPQPEASTQDDNSQSQSTAKDGHLQQQTVGLTGNSSLINNVDDCLIPESTLFDFDLDSWTLENNSSDVGPLEVPMSPVWNTFSSDPLDPGFLLDG